MTERPRCVYLKQIVVTTYGVYAAGLNAPLAGGAAKSAVSACMANPSGCTVLVTQAAEAGAGLVTGAVTVGNAWEGPVGALSRAKAAKHAVPAHTEKQLDTLVRNAVHESQTARAASNFKRYTAAESRLSIAQVFNGSDTGLRLGMTEIKEMANSANRVNTTRVFDSSKISNAQLRKEVFEYAESLGGGKLAERVPGQIWNIKTTDGATINVRSKSTTALPDGSKPRWTIEMVGDKKLNQMTRHQPNQRLEIKFK